MGSPKPAPGPPPPEHHLQLQSWAAAPHKQASARARSPPVRSRHRAGVASCHSSSRRWQDPSSSERGSPPMPHRRRSRHLNVRPLVPCRSPQCLSCHYVDLGDRTVICSSSGSHQAPKQRSTGLWTPAWDSFFSGRVEELMESAPTLSPSWPHPHYSF